MDRRGGYDRTIPAWAGEPRLALNSRPELRDVRRDDQAFVTAALRDFVLPWIAIRNRGRGYAVSMIKAGLQAVGRSCGGVRPPLLDVAKGDYEDLAALIQRITA
jgi:5-dehydro-4-deoxyglucarate dehydratase